MYHYDLDFDFVSKNGLTYGRVVNSGLRYEIQRAHYRFDNLFDGDKKIGTYTIFPV